ncbi:MAG: crossover junction endodeoxyribonuclease RuvC, partial [Solirubrobacterales bacterium]
VESRGSALVALDGGVIETAANTPLELRLARIAARVEALIDEHNPEVMAIESIYFGKNVETAFSVGQGRGAVICEAGKRAIPVNSYTPQQIKLSVCGSGSAAKAQVQTMIAALLDLPGPVPPDHAADALAVAVCHLNSAPLAAAIGAAS